MGFETWRVAGGTAAWRQHWFGPLLRTVETTAAEHGPADLSADSNQNVHCPRRSKERGQPCSYTRLPTVITAGELAVHRGNTEGPW